MALEGAKLGVVPYYICIAVHCLLRDDDLLCNLWTRSRFLAWLIKQTIANMAGVRLCAFIRFAAHHADCEAGRMGCIDNFCARSYSTSHWRPRSTTRSCHFNSWIMRIKWPWPLKSVLLLKVKYLLTLHLIRDGCVRIIIKAKWEKNMKYFSRLKIKGKHTK